jgi:hypothetical protein
MDMSDQCSYCSVKGNYNECVKTECFHHENWINKTRIKRIEALELALEKISELPGDRVDEGANIALNILALLPPQIN